MRHKINTMKRLMSFVIAGAVIFQIGITPAFAQNNESVSNLPAGNEDGQSRSSLSEPNLNTIDEIGTPSNAQRTVSEESLFFKSDGKLYIGSNGNVIEYTGDNWRSEGEKLILENFQFESTKNALTMEAGTILELRGENSLTGLRALQAYKDLTIIGDGTLKASSKLETILGSLSVTVSGVTLNLTSSSAQALYSINNLTVKDEANIISKSCYEGLTTPSGADINISGAILDLRSTAGNTIVAGDNLYISNSTVNSVGVNSALYANMNIDITKSKIIAESTENSAIFTTIGKISIKENSDITAEGYYCGLQSNSTGISIADSKVNAVSVEDNAIFTKGTLEIGGKADVTASGGKYCGLHAKGAITLSGGKIEAISPFDVAIYSPVSIDISGNADVDATGAMAAISSGDVSISGGAVKASSGEGGAIVSTTKLSVTGDAVVDATGFDDCVVAEDGMVLSAKKIDVFSENGHAIVNNGEGKDITIGGTLVAESKEYCAIRSYGKITADTANIDAKGPWSGLWADGDITLNGSNVSSIGTVDEGIYSTGKITINGANIYAKGGEGKAAIRTRNAQKENEDPAANIIVENVIEKSGGKVAFSDSFDLWGTQTNCTTFIDKGDNAIVFDEQGEITNALPEVWLATPVTVSFNVNGGSGENTSIDVYPGNKVEAPKTESTQEGYHFAGWYLNGKLFDIANTGIEESMTLKAEFAVHTPNKDDGNCTTPILCSVCGVVMTPAKIHAVTVSQSSSVGHWKKCANVGCTYKDKTVAHTAGNWIIDKKATISAKGSRHKECKTCKYTVQKEATSVALTSIKIIKNPSKTSYVSGQLFDKRGMVVRAYFDSGEYRDVTTYTVLPTTALTTKNTYVRVNYKYGTKTCTTTLSIKVVPVAVSGIKVTTAPKKTSYVSGQKFDRTGMIVKLCYNNGSSKTVTSYTVLPTTPLTTKNTYVRINFKYGTKTFTTTQKIKVMTSIKVTTPPKKTTYVQGQKFDKTGMVVKLYYNDGSSQTVTSYTVLPTTPLTTKNTYVRINFKYGTKTFTTTYKIKVVPVAVSGIKVTTPPKKTTYVQGQKFDKKGMVVKLYYNNGTSKTVTSYTILPTAALTTKNTYVRINFKYGTKTYTTTHKIKVVPVSLSSIKVVKPPKKTTYIQGQKFSRTGMVVKAYYNNGASKVITSYSVSPTTALTTKNTYVRISYKSGSVTKTVTQKIRVKAK